MLSRAENFNFNFVFNSIQTAFIVKKVDASNYCLCSFLAYAWPLQPFAVTG